MTTAEVKFHKPIRISQIEEDLADIVISWGPLYKDTTHQFFVRGVPVSRTTVTKTENERMYRVCIFPDYRAMWVNEGNLSSKRVNKGYAQ